MRYKHESILRIRNVLGTRLRYVINMFMEQYGYNQKQLAMSKNIPAHSISAIINFRSNRLSFDNLLTIADRLDLIYEINISRQGNGVRDINLKLPSYFDPDGIVFIPEQFKESRMQH